MPTADRFSTCAGLLDKWAPALAKHLGRPEETIRSRGLGAGDFGAGELTIAWDEGSVLRFAYAFCLVDAEKKKLAVFTEHLGYHEFPAQGANVTRVTTEYVYRDEEADEGA